MSILSESNPDKETLLQGLQEDIAVSWPFFLAESLCRVLMGFLLILIPPFLVLENLTHLYGWIFFSLALVGLMRAFKAQNLQGFLPALFTAAFTLVFGLVLLVYPLGPMLNLRSILILYLLIDGLSGFSFAFQFKAFRHASGSYFTSTLALLIALLLGLGWPAEQHFWQSSTLLGALYCLQGFLLLALALGMEHWVKQHDQKPLPAVLARPTALNLNNPKAEAALYQEEPPRQQAAERRGVEQELEESLKKVNLHPLPETLTPAILTASGIAPKAFPTVTNPLTLVSVAQSLPPNSAQVIAELNPSVPAKPFDPYANI